MSLEIPLKKQFLVFCLLILIFLVGLEISLRIFDEFQPNCKFLGKDALNNIDLKKQKEMCEDYNSIKYLKIGEYNFPEPNQNLSHLNINSLGIRGEELIYDNESYKILVSGGSTVFGDGASSDKTTIPAILEQKLNSYYEIEIQVFNAGVGGIDSDGEIIMLKKLMESIEPDLVIIYDGWNDIRQENFQNAGSVGIVQQILKYYKTPAIIYKLFFTDYNLGQLQFNRESQINASEDWKNNWIDFCQRERNYQVSIFLQPLLFYGKDYLSNDERKSLTSSPFLEHQRLGHELLSEKIVEISPHCEQITDLRQAFSDISEPIYFDYGHMSDFGNEIIASKIFEKIIILMDNKIDLK